MKIDCKENKKVWKQQGDTEIYTSNSLIIYTLQYDKRDM
jgi:hypothetical protein